MSAARGESSEAREERAGGAFQGGMAAVSMPLASLPASDRAPLALVRGEGAAAGVASFDAVVREHEAAMRAFALRLCRDPADASDLVQSAFERALRRWATFTPGTSARAWLFSILHNAFIDRCRRQAAGPRTACLEEVDVPAPPPSERSAWAEITPEQVSAAVARLEPEFLAVYRLHADEGLSYQQIGARLGIPVNTVGTRLARARRKLRALLQGHAEGDAE
jgi:RNA polymerase sigma-70 factor (ECF subfamily)